MEVRLRTCAAIIAIACLHLSATRGDAGPRRPATDCLASWSSAECDDDDGECDRHAGPGCLFDATVCFNNGPGDEGCPHRDIEAVSVQRPLLKGARGALAEAVIDALVELGGTEERRFVSFAHAPEQRCASFEVFVPRDGERSARAILGTKTKAGRMYDGDRSRFVCHPPDPESDHAPPLSSGCLFGMDRDECESHDGEFSEAAGSLQLPHCFCRTEDFGEPCDDPAQCQGLCFAPAIDASEGTCSEHVTAFGCFLLFLREGVVSSVCID
jgi:hypothetical protein